MRAGADFDRDLRHQLAAGKRAPRLQALPAPRAGAGRLLRGDHHRRGVACPALGRPRPGRRCGHRLDPAPGDQDPGADPLRLSLVADPACRTGQRPQGRRADGPAGARPGRLPPDAAGDHQPGLAARRGKRQRAGVGLGCDAVAGDHHRHGVRSGRIPHPGRAGCARRSGRAARHADRVAADGADPGRPRRGRPDRAGSPPAGAALPARRVRRAGDRSGLRRVCSSMRWVWSPTRASSWPHAPSSRSRTRSRRCISPSRPQPSTSASPSS